MEKQVPSFYGYIPSKQLIGRGAYGEVYLFKKPVNPADQIDGQPTVQNFAAKVILAKWVEKNKDNFNTEISIMYTLDHPNILKMHEYFEHNNYYVLILNYCNRGSLKDLIKRGPIPEPDAVYYLIQIINGFMELSKHKIFHRDIKPDNLLLHDDLLVIGDFGLSKAGVDLTATKVGSPMYMAPEILLTPEKAHYSCLVDIWSIGVTIYECIFGKPPFDVSDEDELKKAVITQSSDYLKFPSKIPISDLAKDLLKKMIQPNPQKRIRLFDLLRHPLLKHAFSEGEKTDDGNPNSQSVLIRSHQSIVSHFFDSNASLSESELEKVLDMNESFKEQPPKPKNTAAREKKTFIGDHLLHQKKICLLVPYATTLSKELMKTVSVLSPKMAEGLLYLGCLLTKYAEVNTSLVIYKLESIKQGLDSTTEIQNILSGLDDPVQKACDLEFFDWDKDLGQGWVAIVNSNRYNEFIAALGVDQKNYRENLAYWRGKVDAAMKERPESTHLKKLIETMKLEFRLKSWLKRLIDDLKIALYHVAIIFKTELFDRLDDKLRNEFTKSLAQYFSILECKEMIPIKTGNGVSINWENYYGWKFSYEHNKLLVDEILVKYKR